MALGGSLIGADDPHAIYEQVMDAAVALMRSQFASMQLYHPASESAPQSALHSIGQLELLAHRGFNTETEEIWHWVQAHPSTACGIALKNGKRCIEPDLANLRQITGTADLNVYLAAGIHFVQSTPLFSRSGKLLGMISTHWDHPHQPSETELRNLDILARQAADIIERRQTEHTIRQNQRGWRHKSRRCRRRSAAHGWRNRSACS